MKDNHSLHSNFPWKLVLIEQQKMLYEDDSQVLLVVSELSYSRPRWSKYPLCAKYPLDLGHKSIPKRTRYHP